MVPNKDTYFKQVVLFQRTSRQYFAHYMVNKTQFSIDNGKRSTHFEAFVYNRYFSICLYQNPDNVFIKEMDDFITCTLRCIYTEMCFCQHILKKKNRNLILKVAVDGGLTFKEYNSLKIITLIYDVNLRDIVRGCFQKRY